AVWTLTGMACGAAALAPLLSPQAVVKRSAARRTGGIIKNDVIAENLDINVALKEISQSTEQAVPSRKRDLVTLLHTLLEQKSPILSDESPVLVRERNQLRCLSASPTPKISPSQCCHRSPRTRSFPNRICR